MEPTIAEAMDRGPAVPSVKRFRRWWPWALAVLVLAAGGAAVMHRLNSNNGQAAGHPIAQPAGKPRPALVVSQPRIVVEKSAHRLTLYDGQRAVKEYRAAVGGGQGDKVREGDRCTPEGRFYICVKNPQSKYTLSLGLSYPNDEDAARGLRDGLITQEQHDRIVRAISEKAQPDWYTPLGGEIMIHGCGAGRDWTHGCIALDDDDIRELYDFVEVGTEVTVLK